ncbi:hypothetical protein ACFCZV_32550 [Streptomyces hydrogenans]|uniref:hypothetical protein n=1 Tax=Streptomyces hydrogenans TaxID=1873719 RepID=UPI0035DB688F
MGIESDRMVMDYLSEVGDVAQQRHLPPADRTALVAGLRDEIDRRRATYGEESPSAVRGILGDLGTPAEVVGRASGGDRTAPVPPPRDWWSETADTADTTGADGRAAAPAPSGRETAAVPGPRGWSAGLAPGDADDDLHVPGFVGGVEAPELFRPPEPEEAEDDPEPETPPPGKARRLVRLLRARRPAPAPEAEEEPEDDAPPRARGGFAHPFLLLAALLLIAGAAFGWLIALALGWLLAYGSRRLTPAQVKTAVFVLPGAAAAGGIAWLWGRVEGRWGEAVAAGGDGMNQAVADTWPWTLRAAALASALYLLLRARRR